MSASLTPLGINSVASLLQNIGFYINPGVVIFLGSSKTNSDYSMGALVADSCLRLLTYAINDAYKRSVSQGQNEWYSVTNSGWSTFMNTYAIWTNGSTDRATYNSNSQIEFPVSGNYLFEVEVDDSVTVFIDGIYQFDHNRDGGKKTFEKFVSAGNHLLVLSVTNTGGPAGVAMYISYNTGGQSDGESVSPVINTKVWDSRMARPIARASWGNVTYGAWGTFMNTYAIWPGNQFDVKTVTYSTTLTFNGTGNYTFNWGADNMLSAAIDGKVIITGENFTGMGQKVEYVTSGKHTITLTITNWHGPGGVAMRILDRDGAELWNTRTVTPLVTNGPTVTNTTYNKLVSIGQYTIPILGNAPPLTYDTYDASRKWSGQATTGYGIIEDPYISQGQSQTAQWYPFNCTNFNMGVTQWGFLRTFALQAWNEFNYNGIPYDPNMPQYKDFCASFMTADTFIGQLNKNIFAFQNSPGYLLGTYSNMDDLISADVTNVTLATYSFGQDCINAGKIIDLSKIDRFGLPSALLQTMAKNSAITQAVGLALLSAGLTVSEINDISSEQVTGITVTQEQQIYAAFLVILGKDLLDVCIILNCYTEGLESLADLLDVKKIFPTSYMSLTVPVYNTIETPTNSKTSYLIFRNGAANPDLKNPSVASTIGTIIPQGIPTIRDIPINTLTRTQQSTNSPVTIPNKYQALPVGFDSYLVDILTEDLALTAGAFSVAMQQIKNISFVDFESFSQIISNIETIRGLPLINGTNVPVNVPLALQGYNIMALGTGPSGSYTFSDFFGCMSGLPYKWQRTIDLLRQLETKKLRNIYRELYLGVTWGGATVSVQYTTYVQLSVTYYKVTGLTITSSGGGYGRGGAPAPTITILGPTGATAVATIGTDDNDITNFGRVTKITLTSSGTDGTTIPTATIQCPPTATLAINIDGSIPTTGTNTPAGTTGWNNPMDTVVDAYINQANAEITDIKNKNGETSTTLNTLYENAGKQLKQEQRTRFVGLPKVAVPRDDTINPYPSTILNFIDSMSSFAGQTLPQMASQTLDAISNFDTIGGQSMRGLMRQYRNVERLALTGIPVESEIPSTLSDRQLQDLLNENGFVQSETGAAKTPGSLSGSDYTDLVPPNLQIGANFGVLGPSVPNVPDAIDTVILCNCDCWLH